MVEPFDAATETVNPDEAVLETELAVLKALMSAIAAAERDFISAEFRRIVKTPGILERADEMMPYLYAAAYVSYAGREITEENIGAVLRAAGFKPDVSLMRLLDNANVKSHLIYIYSYYFLVALGRMGSAEEMTKLAKALDMDADEGRANDVLLFMKAPKKQQT